MNTRQQTILNALQTGPQSIRSLADSIAPWVPFASVRRNIQELRRAGYNINDARDNNGLYRLVA